MGVIDGFLGIGWPAWGRWAACTWLMLFASAWVSLLWAWGGDMTGSLWLSGIVLSAVGIVNGMPGAAALLNPGVRQRLLTLPEAAALASLTLSGTVGIGGFVGASLLVGDDVQLVTAGIVIGIVAFPLTFGMVFPLGIPLGCCFVVWSSIRARGGISRTGFAVATSVAAVGWAAVVLIGAALGFGT